MLPPLALRYVTTTHVINSAIVKTSKLTKARPVYRGVAGGVLPDNFWVANEQDVMGGIELAFMSTTFDRAVAMHYASQPGKPALVFEMQMGMIDRGCELGWISQYPHEAECLFAPLTGLEVQETSVEGSVLLIKARLSVNLNALTIEQVVSKRRALIDQMAVQSREVVALKAASQEEYQAWRKEFMKPVKARVKARFGVGVMATRLNAAMMAMQPGKAKNVEEPDASGTGPSSNQKENAATRNLSLIPE